MPWHVEQGGGSCAAGEWAVIQDSDGSTAGCHESKEDAEAQMAALYASEEKAMSTLQELRREARGDIDSGMIELRAAAARQQPHAAPNGAARSQPFKAQLRAQLVEFNGQARFRLNGHASIVGRGYEMWDMFGPYTEIVSPGAFDETLAANPDVAFLVNHRGVTMARTTNGSLELSADELGLASIAHVNPERQDVKDLVHAIDDRDITEMSFAFMIDDGGWSDDYETFTIERVNIDRGDVSAVNYGANPYTSIAARAHEIIASLDQLPAGAARAALRSLQNRADMRLNLQQPVQAGQSQDGPASQNGTAESTATDGERGQSEPQRTGRSTSLITTMLLLEDED